MRGDSGPATDPFNPLAVRIEVDIAEDTALYPFLAECLEHFNELRLVGITGGRLLYDRNPQGFSLLFNDVGGDAVTAGALAVRGDGVGQIDYVHSLAACPV